MRQTDPPRAWGSAARDRAAATGRPEPSLAGELRDTERTISFWRRKACEFGGLPPPTVFDFSPMLGGAWSHRFVVFVDPVSGDLKLLTYGSKFAELLELPEQPIDDFPINRHLPGRYLPLFTEGCRDAIAQAGPVRSSGVIVEYGQIELYRAAFMPLASRQNSPMQLVFGSFNRRLGPNAHASDAVRAMYNSLIEDIQSEKAVTLRL